MFRKFFIIGALAVLIVGGSVACATKKQVRTSVGEVNDKVEALAKSVEDAQERTRRIEARVAEVDANTQNAAQSAQQANTAARDARTAAATVNDRVGAVDEKVDTLDRIGRRLVFEVVLSQDEGNFKLGQSVLPPETKQKLDTLVQRLKAESKSVFLEIEGHTDSIGTRALNRKIGLERAQAVQQYLYDRYQIPLHKMSVISYGEDKPVAPNSTKAGRAQNRRVVIKVLT